MKFAPLPCAMRSGLSPRQPCDAAHVGKLALTDVVDVVPPDQIALRGAACIPPYPANGNPCVEKIEDVIVGYSAVEGVCKKDTHSRRMEPAAMGYEAVVYFDMGGHPRRIFHIRNIASRSVAAQILDAFL